MLDTIMDRRSVRFFTDQPVLEEDLHTILKAGMSGPTAVNARDWAFIVVRDPVQLNKMADANGRPAEPLRRAKVGVLICGDLNRAFSGAKDYWVVDCAIAGQNMLLAAASLGIGGVWLGTWPQIERVQAQSALFGLPDHIRPHSILAFGYPTEKEKLPHPNKPEWEADRVHYEQWAPGKDCI